MGKKSIIVMMHPKNLELQVSILMNYWYFVARCYIFFSLFLGFKSDGLKSQHNWLRIVRIILSQKKKKFESNNPNLKLAMYINIMYLKIW